jgi:hypothetical protein
MLMKQFMAQHMSVKNKLTNHSCGLAAAVSDGKIGVFFFSYDNEKRRGMMGRQLIECM